MLLRMGPQTKGAMSNNMVVSDIVANYDSMDDGRCFEGVAEGDVQYAAEQAYNSISENGAPCDGCRE